MFLNFGIFEKNVPLYLLERMPVQKNTEMYVKTLILAKNVGPKAQFDVK